MVEIISGTFDEIGAELTPSMAILPAKTHQDRFYGDNVLSVRQKPVNLAVERILACFSSR